ncbi:hypothetical protein ACP70R_032935 [Stipagrostis hirtigluma subsp. patula]
MEEQGYFSNLLNEDNNTISFDDFSSPPSEQQAPNFESNPQAPNFESFSQAPNAESIPQARPNQKRSKNFNEKEDALLVSAWLNISTDAVHGTNQNRGAFWKRIFDFYQENKDFTSDRSQNSLSHRWTSIQENVNKFCGCVSQIERRRQSGATYHDNLFKAEDKENKSFQFLHCWNILRNEPKWREKQMQLTALKQASKKRPKTNIDSTTRTSIPINDEGRSNDVGENGTPETEAPKRPMGKKKAKAALRRPGGDACIDALDNLWGKKKESDAEKEKKKEERYKQSYELEVMPGEMIGKRYVQQPSIQTRCCEQIHLDMVKLGPQEDDVLTSRSFHGVATGAVWPRVGPPMGTWWWRGAPSSGRGAARRSSVSSGRSSSTGRFTASYNGHGPSTPLLSPQGCTSAPFGHGPSTRGAPQRPPPPAPPLLRPWGRASATTLPPWPAVSSTAGGASCRCLFHQLLPSPFRSGGPRLGRLLPRPLPHRRRRLFMPEEAQESKMRTGDGPDSIPKDVALAGRPDEKGAHTVPRGTRGTHGEGEPEEPREESCGGGGWVARLGIEYARGQEQDERLSEAEIDGSSRKVGLS